MEAAPAASSVFPYLRSCKQESSESVTGTTKGEIPKWLKGTLIRVGPGLMEVGPDRYNHAFDGLALMHAFRFEGGNVTYRSRFLRSDTYQRNLKANRIVVTEFGTSGVPDPCKTIFQRLQSAFSFDDFTDNDLVTIVRYSDEVYACSETNTIWRISPDDLQSIKSVKMSDYVSVNMASAHTHEDNDGTVYNVGSSFGRHGTYNIIKFSPKQDPSENAFQRGSVVAKIPFSQSNKPCYFHSFGMTENYFVFVEQPLFMGSWKMLLTKFLARSFENAMTWDSKMLLRFHVVRRSDGQLLSTKYLSKPFFVFHHINTYEEENHLVVDMCCFENANVIKSLYVKAMEEMYANKGGDSSFLESRARRYVIPIIDTVQPEKTGENIVKIQNCEAKALIQADGTVLCVPEILTGNDPWSPELPRINYEVYNGKKYKYFYAIARNDVLERTHLIKVNTETHSSVSWKEDGVIPSEPVFIADPNSTEKDEDSGVILASLLYSSDERKVSMLVLNAKTMTEIGRVDYLTESSVPGDFHGAFVNNVQ